MFFERTRPAIHFACAALVAATLLASGCGRSPVDPLAPGDKPSPDASADPGGDNPADPGAPDAPVPAPGGSTGGGATGGTTGGTGAGGGTAPAGGGAKPAPKGGLKPLPKPTPIPAFKTAPAPAGGDPSKAMDGFVNLLANFGYSLGDDGVHNARMQLQPMLHVPPARLHWDPNDDLAGKYNYRKTTFPFPISFEQWQQDAVNLAARDQNFTFYVGRRELYRGILQDRYHDVRSDQLLVFYKRLNRTGYMVTYTPDGVIDDYGYFGDVDWRNFILVPAAFYQ